MPTSKKNIGKIIFSPNIIKGLPPIHAFWIGYYYAHETNTYLAEKLSLNNQDFHFELQKKIGRFKILSMDTRASIINYYDEKIKLKIKKKL